MFVFLPRVEENRSLPLLFSSLVFALPRPATRVAPPIASPPPPPLFLGAHVQTQGLWSLHIAPTIDVYNVDTSASFSFGFLAEADGSAH